MVQAEFLPVPRDDNYSVVPHQNLASRIDMREFGLDEPYDGDEEDELEEEPSADIEIELLPDESDDRQLSLIEDDRPLSDYITQYLTHRRRTKYALHNDGEKWEIENTG